MATDRPVVARNGAIRLAPSLLSADLGALAVAIQSAEKAGADALHVDVMDGHFVPNITFGPSWLSAVRRRTRLPLDVHLMIDNPRRYMEAFARAGGDTLVFHVEVQDDPRELLALARRLSVGVGVAIRPETPIGRVAPFLGKLDELIVMSVHPGFSGQKFLPEVLPKLHEARRMLDREGATIELSVDGGITAGTAQEAASAGATMMVCGNSVFSQGTVAENLTRLRTAAELGRRELREVR